ncbi:hypothetical protein EYF80_006683 [Liparis tanakae]|uniref:Uncharacterized protein n=1 Tax=Liparis tanakae TaxID=230148 RepID=A0A4Z2IYW5_9TELE|nr:hypothetical protein EYF80_006683 [Liparis tanakae]
MEPVSLYLAKILLTQPCETRSCRLMSHEVGHIESLAKGKVAHYSRLSLFVKASVGAPTGKGRM